MKLPFLCSLALAAVLSSTTAFAQTSAAKIDFPAASPTGSIKQRVGITDIEIEYSRPSMKKREVFGKLVPYDQVWRTGANAATKITFSTPVIFDRVTVPAGTYGLYTIPNKDEWTLILNKDSAQWGSYSYKQENDVARVRVKPQKLSEPVETLSIEVTDIRADGATITVEWDETRVPFKFTVDATSALIPEIESVMSSNSDKKPYANAAMFYFENKIDLRKAATWMGEAVKAQPNAFWLTYRHALILQALGDKPGALAAAQSSLAEARKAGGAVGTEYVELNEDLIDDLD